MPTIRADRLFFYILLSLALLATIVLVWPYIGAVVLAVTVAVVLQPLHRFFLRLARGHNGPATVLTMIATRIMVVIPVLLGFVLLLDAFSALAEDLAGAVQAPRDSLMQPLQELEAWIIQSGIADRIAFQQGDIQQTAQSWFSQLGSDFIGWVASIGMSTFNLIVPFIVFFSLLGTLLAYGDRTIQLVKDISPMDDAIDQLFLDRLRIMTRAMMRSIIIVAFAQGAVTGLLMAVGSTPHIIPLTILAMLLAILPGGAALVAVPVGLIHLYVGNTWQGAIIILASVTFIAGLDNQLRPLLVSKDAYLNRALVLLSVFSGIALFGFMGVVYGPLIMIFASTTLEVYLGYFHPDVPEATPQPVTSPESPTDSESEQ